MKRPTAAMLVIGDEILSGRTRDANMHHLAGVLTEAGITLAEVRIVPDEHAVIVDALNALRAAHDTVFTSGGIGPTHDDITADAVAAAFGVSVDVRDDARSLLAAHYEATGRELNEARLRMARIPDGATLIDNPVSVAPGVSLGNVHVMAGVPSVFQAMVASVMPSLKGGPPLLSRSLRVPRGEGDIAGPLGEIAASASAGFDRLLPLPAGRGLWGQCRCPQQRRGRLGKRNGGPETGLSGGDMSDPLFRLIDATWPAASMQDAGGWTIREGQGGGNRVSAATWDGDGAPDIALAESHMAALGQEPVFMIRPQDDALDAALDKAGYEIRDATQGYRIDVTQIAEAPPAVTSFTCWPPLAIQTEIWAEGGIGAGTACHHGPRDRAEDIPFRSDRGQACGRCLRRPGWHESHAARIGGCNGISPPRPGPHHDVSCCQMGTRCWGNRAFYSCYAKKCPRPLTYILP